MNRSSREQFILQHYPMVRAIARRMARRYPECVDVDDLVSIGMIGLIDSADRFEQHRLPTFTAYARIRVQGAIVDALRTLDFVPRSVRQRARRIADVRQRLTESLGRAPTAREIATDLGLDMRAFEDLERNSHVGTVVSLEEQRNKDDRDVDLPSPEPTPADGIDQIAIREQIEGAIRELAPRDQQILRLYYFEEMSFREIGRRLGVTESRVSQLHSRIKQRLQESLAVAA